MYLKIITASFSLIFLFSCSHDPEIPKLETSFEIVVPKNLGSELPQPSDNIATKDGVELGKKLFFDPILSANYQISCSNCHHANLAFTDGLALSNKGISGNYLLRNAPSLFNLAWAKGYFADGGAKNLESQVFAPLQHPDEMGKDIIQLVKELNAMTEYRFMAQKAFGSDTLNSSLIANAIAQFERSLISGDSKYDKWVRGEGEVLNALEINGLEVYNKNCSICHASDFFTDFDYHNNGLDSTFNDNSFENVYKGRYRITNKTEDIGKFKTPSLRNLSFTAPYMHDGRFSTLDEVIEHYNSGIQYYATLDTNLLLGGLKLSLDETNALKAFLNTLNDYDFISKSILLNPD